ncbi:sugar transferase, partial [Paenibacillus sepulcri]|nr:sugar transferase [Paenibacillus sepulcri]
WEEKFALDLWYVQHRSLRLDVGILLLSVRKVFRSEGIQNGNHATMPVFKGSVKGLER